MAEILTAIGAIKENISDALGEIGMKAIVPEGCAKGELPVSVLPNGTYRLEYASESGSIRLDFFNNALLITISQTKDDEGNFTNFLHPMTSMLDPDDCDAKELRSISNEVQDHFNGVFGKKDVLTGKVKAPKPVSKAAAKSGAVYYDANTLANRLTASLFTELRSEYNANIAKYGDFFAEEFFISFGTPAVMALIKENNPQRMKKLFSLLNEIYPDATNETQSLIAVSILGEIDNDQELLARCVDYMCPDLLGPVIQVNKFLATSAGKRAKEKLKNPPPYKPKRAKKGGLMSSLMGMGGTPQK